jgi:hypothetical protein
MSPLTLAPQPHLLVHTTRGNNSRLGCKPSSQPLSPPLSRNGPTYKVSDKGSAPAAACGRSSDFGLRPSFGFRLSGFGFGLVLSLLSAGFASQAANTPETLFQAGLTVYRSGDYLRAADAFRASVAQEPSSGALQNLGNAEWQQQRAGGAILAWEQALWLDPFNPAARQNLRFARKTAQLEAPDLTWYEVISTWLPVSWWGWIAGVSLWLAVGMVLLPGILRLRKATWHQAVAALGLMVFLLSVPAHVGVYTRSRLGFILQPDTPLRLTPTLEAQAITRLAAGEPARRIRARGDYVLIRTSRTLGWVEVRQVGLTCPAPDGKDEAVQHDGRAVAAER